MHIRFSALLTLPVTTEMLVMLNIATPSNSYKLLLDVEKGMGASPKDAASVFKGPPVLQDLCDETSVDAAYTFTLFQAILV